MKRKTKFTLGLLIAACALLGGVTATSRSKASPDPVSFVPCPAHLTAPYGGTDGWSSVNVQAKFARARVTPTRMMVCQYRFGLGAPFFGIEKPCPVGSTCIPVRNGFRVLP